MAKINLSDERFEKIGLGDCFFELRTNTEKEMCLKNRKD